MKKKNLSKIILIAAILIIVLLYFIVPSFNATMKNFVTQLGSLNLEAVVELIRGYGVYAAIISFILMILQIDSCANTCSTNHFSKCSSIWLVEGRTSIVLFINGRSSTMLLHR